MKDENEISVLITLPSVAWEKYCHDAKHLGFSGEDYLKLSVMNDSECILDIQRFEEMNEVPAWAAKKLRAFAHRVGGSAKESSEVRNTCTNEAA